MTLLGDGIGAARFGEPQGQAIIDLDKVLGHPLTTSFINEKGNCTIDAALRWPGVTAYFYHHHFVGFSSGFSYGSPRRNPDVTTASGLRVGDSMAQARKIYGADLTTSFAQGGSWFVKTADGTLDGDFTDEINRGNPAPEINNIDAGSVGCPAASP